ncbi:MAG: pilus assembly protein TadE [Sphingobium sp.]|uniref:TadE/TadG family type IV pilus assembly protein n=1 Tax=Sphingobium sp. TaxID=1912891 RepID=UPI000DB2E272|nr:TadE/TadG family type IV pilus assembly protein [Sphingobium sp.]PZU06976.1 MAG: pilus assembly protein TadE [Sphingobium sp.]
MDRISAIAANDRPCRARSTIYADRRGSVLVEAAFALPLLALLLTGILGYGCWFMTAHSLQQAANDAARAAVAGLDAGERRALVDQSVAAARSAFPVQGAETITATTSEHGGFYRVTLRFRLANAAVFAALPVALPSEELERSAVVRLTAS